MRLLGVDVGTTSLKAVLFDENGKPLSSVCVDYTLHASGERVELEAETYWRIFRQALDQVCPDRLPDAIAIDTQCETLILADAKGNPLMNAIVWLDNRAKREAQEIEAQFGRKEIYEKTGQPEVTATWPACKILWIKKHLPQIWSKTRKIFLLEDYLLYRLTGEFATEKTLQSSSLYFDINTGSWWPEMLDFIGIPEEYLPRIEDSGVFLGTYGSCRVVTGAMDQVAGAIGAGIVSETVISEMTGTTMAIFANAKEIPPFRADSIIPCHYNFNGKYCLLLWTPTAGMALKWFKNNLCENFSFRELDALAEKVPPGSGGLVFLPYLCGSTMPKYNPEARGCFAGLTLEHTRGHFVRSILESVACMLRENLEYLGISPKEIRVTGGGAESPLWCRIKADITGTDLKTLKNKETACLGSAILAGHGIGLFPSIEEASRRFAVPDRVFHPSGADQSDVYKNFRIADRLMQGGLNS
ncbi:MAG: hypothetical protein DBX53_08525 [Clostridiales bacterium]|nr:MAG: hypothetical protein DBX53_08525 [Clostridiales bacterium]